MKHTHPLTRLGWLLPALLLLLLASGLLGVLFGTADASFLKALRALASPTQDPMLHAIIWKIRVPRVLLAMSVGAALSLGGLVFQALLRNPLAEPYILGISGGAAIGAIIGILLGLARFPGVAVVSFLGSLVTLGVLLAIAAGRTAGKESLLLSGVMVNAFCSALILFLVSLTQDSRLHNILFWLMGDLSQGDLLQAGIIAAILLPCAGVLFRLASPMNLFLLGKEIAQTSGIQIRRLSAVLLIVTSVMVSVTVSQCGLIGFVGLVVPHILRLLLGPDHRILVPACFLGGATYMVLCDLLARTLPAQGEMPAGVVTAMIGAPIFILLLKRSE